MQRKERFVETFSTGFPATSCRIQTSWEGWGKHFPRRLFSCRFTVPHKTLRANEVDSREPIKLRFEMLDINTQYLTPDPMAFQSTEECDKAVTVPPKGDEAEALHMGEKGGSEDKIRYF